jgi:hypothetical protein
MKPESWSFGMGHNRLGHDDGMIDITDDNTGELHDKAQKSLLPYVNETDGKETATIHAIYDPEGAVHYLIGHRDDNDPDFTLVPGMEPIEVKVDYLEAYEKVRIQKGYSRLPEIDRLKREQTAFDDYETLKDILLWSVNEILGCLQYLEDLDLSKSCEVNVDCRKRCLVFAVQMIRRLRNVEKEFESNDFDIETDSYCDNGYLALHKVDAVSRTKRFIRSLCNMWESADDALDSLLSSDDVFKFAIATSVFGFQDGQKLKKVSADEFLNKLQAM